MSKEEKSVFKILNKIDDEVFEERKEINEELLNEESLSRIYQHLKNGRPFALISACRGLDKENSTQEEIDKQERINKENSRLLEKSILLTGFGFNRVNEASTEKDLDGDEIPTYETSYIVYTPEINRKWETRLYIFCEMQGRKYEQDAVLFFGLDGLGVYLDTKRSFDGKPYYSYDSNRPYDEDDKEKYALSKINVGKADYYTNLPKDKRDFTFVSDEKSLDKERDKKEVELYKKRIDIVNKFFQKRNYKNISIDEGIKAGASSVRLYVGGFPAMGGYYKCERAFNECWNDETDTADEKKLKEFISKYYR